MSGQAANIKPLSPNQKDRYIHYPSIQLISEQIVAHVVAIRRVAAFIYAN